MATTFSAIPLTCVPFPRSKYGGGSHLGTEPDIKLASIGRNDGDWSLELGAKDILEAGMTLRMPIILLSEKGYVFGTSGHVVVSERGAERLDIHQIRSIAHDSLASG
ncbi:MAG: hypothetical protein E5X33_29865 [Mesorhizobium sp.]|uniref:hypothetical protein n=1 Tax=Mesorhizobium sp. TaxID=1871066 RepID=UPI0011F88901|nr:hypothetical protein [Mesorhizobium sp.]TIR16144.1 MAG: hypothetical protein E5X33_29865 [Mesorhizobium sp.]